MCFLPSRVHIYILISLEKSYNRDVLLCPTKRYYSDFDFEKNEFDRGNEYSLALTFGVCNLMKINFSPNLVVDTQNLKNQ